MLINIISQELQGIVSCSFKDDNRNELIKLFKNELYARERCGAVRSSKNEFNDKGEVRERGHKTASCNDITSSMTENVKVKIEFTLSKE